jgi:hypothetical protein
MRCAIAFDKMLQAVSIAYCCRNLEEISLKQVKGTLGPVKERFGYG